MPCIAMPCYICIGLRNQYVFMDLIHPTNKACKKKSLKNKMLKINPDLQKTITDLSESKKKH